MLLPMKVSQCGSISRNFSYFRRRSSLDGNAEREGEKGERQPAQVKIRTLMFGFIILVLLSLLAFGGVFFYQFWKPKYGALMVKTTPPGAMISVDGKQEFPLTLPLRGGRYQLKGVKEG
jgi:hypothetical protein